MSCLQLAHLRTLVLVLGSTMPGWSAADSFPPIIDGRIPTTVDELWGGYDPRKEALETHVVREWKEGEVTFRLVIYTIGTFKGRKSTMAAYYAFPKCGQRLPAIIDVHGGGGSASIGVVRNHALNGYAGLSINWNGKKLERMEDGDPNTDWGAVDGTQTHVESHKDPKALDPVASPRNSIWFLLFVGARRGLTFLEQQPEVDPARLGITGHSMGGKVTVDVAGIDRRVQAAVPSCGGAGGVIGKLSGMPGAGIKSDKPGMLENTIDDGAYIPRITCPILYKSASNDFAGPFDNMTVNWRNIGSREVAYAITPHMNHRSLPETDICGVLWFEQHLKGSFTFPKTPELTVSLTTAQGIPQAVVHPDRPAEVVDVDIYYSVDPHCLTRFWRDAGATRTGDAWTAGCPVLSVDQPLFVFANVRYRLKTDRSDHAGGKAPGTFIVSSRECLLLPQELKDAGVKATDKPSRMIDDFSRGWQDWYLLEWTNPHAWNATTRKIKDLKWRGPAGARLVVEVTCPVDVVLKVVADLNAWGAFPGKPGGSFEALKPVKGSPDWQAVSIALEDMKPVQKGSVSPLDSWETVTELSFRWSWSYLKDGQEVRFGDGNIQKCGWRTPREFRNLRWEGGSHVTDVTAPARMKDTAPADLQDTIQKEIGKSLVPGEGGLR